jgi:hypothetical protein
MVLEIQIQTGKGTHMWRCLTGLWDANPLLDNWIPNRSISFTLYLVKVER